MHAAEFKKTWDEEKLYVRPTGKMKGGEHELAKLEQSNICPSF
jgi:hypothetical protein